MEQHNDSKGSQRAHTDLSQGKQYVCKTEAFKEEEVDYMLDPHNYVGLAPVFADRVVEKYSKS